MADVRELDFCTDSARVLKANAKIIREGTAVTTVMKKQELKVCFWLLCLPFEARSDCTLTCPNCNRVSNATIC